MGASSDQFMKKRGLIVAAGGVVMILASFVVAMDVLERGDLEGNLSLPQLLEGMFDQVSDTVPLYPGQSTTFSFDATSGTEQILWGLQILDYQAGDEVSVTISNIYGDDFGTVDSDQPAVFEALQIQQGDMLNFIVENKGQRPITVVMMFTKNPEQQDRFASPDSPLNRTLVPLAAMGFLLLFGIIVIIAGAIIAVYDYKKRQNSESPSYL